MIDNSGINALSSPLASALCVMGIVAASRLRLKRWTAVSQLLPPATNSEEEKKEAPAAPPPIKGWRRFTTRHALKQLAILFAQIGGQLFICFGLPRISSRLFLDIFWGTAVFALTTFCIGLASTVLVPDAATVVYHREKPESALDIKTEALDPNPPYNWRDHTRTAVAVTTTLAIFASSYYGYTGLQSLGSAGWTTILIAFTGMPKMRMKRVVQVILGFITVVPALTAIIMIGMTLFTNVDMDRAPNHPSRGAALPSDWILSIMSVAIHGMPTVGPGIMLAMAYRYDYSRAAPICLRTSEPVRVSASAPRFSAPLYRAGLVALSIVIGSAHVFRPAFEKLTQGEPWEFYLMFVTNPAVMLALALKAWSQGQLREWWEYEETWIPNKAEVAAMLQDHAEQAPVHFDEKAADEKEVEAGL